MASEDLSSENDISAISSHDSRSSEISFKQSPNRSRKRKASLGAQPKAQPKRLKVREVEKYRKFFNQSLEETTERETPHQHGDDARPGVHGMIWSVDEKDRLFSALGQKGRHHHKVLAAMVGTKSEPEVRAYVQLLQSVATKHDYSSLYRKGLFDVSSIEAAADVDPACADALEVAADTLAAQQFSREELTEKALQPKKWLITRKTAKWAERCLNSGNEGEEIIAKEMPFATLLNIKNLLSLSKHVYMNSKDPDHNWRTLRKSRISTSTTPSAFYSAFSDLHSFILARTKRLVQLSLFFARSRIDAESLHALPSPNVRAADVLTAVEIARMPLNSADYWPNIASRCNLRVFEHVNSRQYWGKRYTHDEVEGTLRNTDNRRGRYRSRSRSESADLSPRRQSSQEASESEAVQSPVSNSSTDHDSSDESSVSSARRPPSSIPQDPHARRHERQTLTQDTYLETLDENRSRAEMQRLWKILGSQEDIEAESKGKNASLPRKPLPPGKRKEDFTDWLNWIDYWDEWETPAGIPPAPAFDEVGGMLRGEDEEESQEMTDDSTEDEEQSDAGTEVESEENSFVEYESDAESEALGSASNSEDGSSGS